VIHARPLAERQGLHAAWLSFAPGMNSSVTGLPGEPDPAATTVDVIVPQRAITVPGEIGRPAPQFAGAFTNVTGRAFAQPLPLPLPFDVWATATSTRADFAA
jgi:hypothetical protein